MNSQSQMLLVDRLNKVCSEYVHEVVMECGKLYGFEGSEALSRLGLSEKVVEKKKEKKINWESSLVEKVSVEKKKEKKINWESSLVEKVEKVSVEKKGRPKKSKKELEVQGEDLFAELIFSAQNPVLENPVLENVLAPPLVKVEVEQNAVEIPVLEKVEVETPLVAVLDVVAEVLVPLPLLEKSKETVVAEEKKVEKKVVVSKAEKEALKAAKEAEKLAKEAEKAAKEAEKLALKEKKEAEKMAKKGEKKPVKKSEKVSEVVEKVEVEKVEVEKVEVKKVSEEVSEADVVKKFEYEGVKYLKSKKTGIIYNMDQEVVGKWNEESEKIDFEEEDDSSDEEE